MIRLHYLIFCLIILWLLSIGSVNSTRDDSPKGKRTHEEAFGLQPSSSSSSHMAQPQSDPPIVLQQGTSSYLSQCMA
jgi:hypothetical protein